MGPKFHFLEKVCPTIFFTYKTSFTTFHVDWSQKIDKNFFEPFFQKFWQVIVPLRDQNFNFWKKCFRQFFSLTKHVSQHFTLIEAKKSTKIFSNHFFKKFYKLLSPYGTKISIFVKSNSDENFLQVIVPLWDQNFNFWKKCVRQFFSLTKQVSQHFTLIEAKKSTKIFSNHFFKKFYKLLSPYVTKISIFVKSNSDKKFLQDIVPLWDQNSIFWKKCVRQFFSLTKHVSQHFTLIEAKKSTKIFSNHFFKKVYKLLSPYGTKISIFVKSVSDKFFHSLKRKNRQKLFRSIFSKKFTSYCPPMGPKFQFLEKVCPTIFFTYKTISQHFTLIEAKKSTNIFSNHFFKKFYKLLSPYGNKISIFVKSVSDKFFHSPNMFHNISRWLKTKNRQKFFRTIFSKNFTSYCPPMGTKFQFLWKVFPINFFTHRICFTTFHVDWSQKIDKNFFEPFFQKILQVIVPLWDQNFNFCKK